MKYLFLSLLLLSVPAHADKSYSNQQCRQIAQEIMTGFATSKVPSRKMMSYYGQMCLPANKSNFENAVLIDAVISDELVVAIKAKLAEQNLIKL